MKFIRLLNFAAVCASPILTLWIRQCIYTYKNQYRLFLVCISILQFQCQYDFYNFKSQFLPNSNCLRFHRWKFVVKALKWIFKILNDNILIVIAANIYKQVFGQLSLEDWTKFQLSNIFPQIAMVFIPGILKIFHLLIDANKRKLYTSAVLSVYKCTLEIPLVIHCLH